MPAHQAEPQGLEPPPALTNALEDDFADTLDAARERIASSRASMQLDAADLELLAAQRGLEALDPAPIALPEEPAWERALATLAEGLHSLRLPARVGFVALGLYLFAFNLSVVRGSSMAPGIHDGDRILIDQVSYVLGDVERGDIVVLRYPLDPSVDYIKRVVGLPGDEVLMAGGALWINGREVAEDYIAEADFQTQTFCRVKEGHYFVLGDNRLHSSDSREFGQVPEELIRGKVDLRLWPPGRIGRLR